MMQLITNYVDESHVSQSPSGLQRDAFRYLMEDDDESSSEKKKKTET